MTTYWFVFVVSLILAFTAKSFKTSKNTLLLAICALIFVFFAFRIGFTPDYYHYEDKFSELHGNRLFEFSDFFLADELLFTVMASYIPFRLALIIQAFLFSALIYYCLRDYVSEKYWWLSNFPYN